MDSRLLKSAILALLVLSLLTARPQTINAHKAGSTFQAWAAASPSIDGNIGTDEWKYADSRDFDLGGGYTGTLYVMNDANNLYIAAKVVDDNFEDGAWPDTDGFYLLFDNDNNGVWSEDYDEYIYISSNDFVDGVIIGGLTTDASQGGTEDGSGAMSDGGGENLFEISHPLDSADNSYDFSLTAGATVGFRMRYHDGDGSGYTSAWGGDTGAEFGDIVVASSPPTLSAYTTVTPTIDGTIDTATEWADADTATIIFGWTYNGTLYVMNDANNLYIAAKIADADFTGNDFLVILFDNNGDGVGREDGDEQMQLVGSTYSDNFYQGGSLKNDVTEGGSNDGDAQATGDGTYNYYEFMKPLDSADDTRDFSLSGGSVVGFDLQYRDETVNNYWADWPSHSAASWAKISIVELIPDFSLNADPSSMTITRGTSDSSTINITSINAFNDAVDLSYSWFGDVPSDVTVDLPGPVTPPSDDSATSNLQVSAGGSASLGPFILRITGSSGSISHSIDVNIEITEETTTTTTTTTETETTETETTETTTPTTTLTTTPTTTLTTPTTTSETTTTIPPAPIPGFPPSSILLGLLIAIIALMMIRRAKK